MAFFNFIPEDILTQGQPCDVCGWRSAGWVVLSNPPRRRCRWCVIRLSHLDNDCPT